jgi:hypothetical protein
MIALYLVLAGVAIFVIWQFFAIRSDIRRSEAILWGKQLDALRDEEDDLLAVELGARIFGPEDSRLINAETAPTFGRWFQSERKALALGWLAEVRDRVRKIVREHRLAASENPHIRRGDEMRVAFQFLLFELMSGVLYFVIFVRGPSHASGVVRSLLDWAGRLRTLAQEVVADERPAVEIVEN